ncbi:hypothetical protein LSUE1_G004051 [Lachnellula suecica]|uniref:NAD dependent epimerase/dehydratase n=1 Tax=Lachnellula suecica TaxID=602035 RepID=A0A8T9CNA7_9HELO|nr:hypothetical protein LSUE1_G004051 [Lachnellula suecica]
MGLPVAKSHSVRPSVRFLLKRIQASPTPSRRRDQATMAFGREIDNIRAVQPRPMEMQVLCMGLSRTCTMSMMTALNQLGYKCYHMVETGATENIKQRHCNCWREALNYKVHGIGKAYGPDDFDKILQNYSAVTDMPCVNFSDELVAAFPNAKVILTQREARSWVNSIETSVYAILTWRIWRLVTCLEPDGLGALRDCLELSLADWTSPQPYDDRKALAAYMPIHVAHIRSLVPTEKLLEFHPRDGWEPLCKFLGKDLPVDQPFPYVNKGGNAANIIKFVVALWLVKKILKYFAALGILWLAWKCAMIYS